ncbi:DUF1257 domain-containing protein [Phycisphaerales bacterium AB-hyl4]|uniref:DUF1257 domain-containing protein n=1 Tax=Natronomicrosphaera hydrolytica TaxID=3242702 RepID=A0ABV4UAF2_9BACT
MSHIVTIKTQVRDPAALAAACRRLNLAEPVRGNAKLFASEAEGLILHLPDWRYPVVAQPQTGELKYDNYNGAWGEQAQLDRLLQAYAVEKARLEARKAGHSVLEQPLPDGSIRLQIQMGGGSG